MAAEIKSGWGDAIGTAVDWIGMAVVAVFLVGFCGFLVIGSVVCAVFFVVSAPLIAIPCLLALAGLVVRAWFYNRAEDRRVNERLGR